MLTPVMVKGQYISEVWSYLPAPGQFINSVPWGLPSSAVSLVGGVDGHLCLGAFGGSVVFRFEQPVENHFVYPVFFVLRWARWLVNRLIPSRSNKTG